jgi:hypothetical protein
VRRRLDRPAAAAQRDRAAPEGFASDARDIPEAKYERIIGPLRKRPPTHEQADGPVVPIRRDAPEE